MNVHLFKFLVLGLVASFFVPGAALAAGAPDAGKAFEPRPLSQPLYGIAPPSTNPELQVHRVKARDGARIYVETYLPAAKDGNEPPARIPNILVMSPYEFRSGIGGARDVLAHLVPRGYSLSFAHVRGTGNSDGCIEVGGPLEVDAAVRVIEYLGRDAPWSNGRVGMYGLSYIGYTQLGAATSEDHSRTKYLKAIVPLASVVGWLDNAAIDGVPTLPGISFGWGLYNGGVTHLPAEAGQDPAVAPSRHHCSTEALREALAHDTTGDVSPYWSERDYRERVENVRAATLMVWGFADEGNLPLALSGFFDRIPARTPRHLVLGQWEHTTPDAHEYRPEWQRHDWMAMVQAWYDRYLLNLPTKVEEWPTVQVQDTTGQWRAESDWPRAGEKPAQLALGPAGTLGTTTPSGSTTYTEASLLGAPGSATFTTEPLPGRLHIAGQPVLDLWVSLDRPDAHVAVTVRALDAAGVPIDHPRIYGARSARHLEPLADNYFRQRHGIAAPVGTPVRIPVRLAPAELVVPEGGRLVVTVTGSVSSLNLFPTAPSGTGTNVTILHDCEHQSALRFRVPAPRGRFMNVREPDEGEEPLRSNPVPVLGVDADGLATDGICGQLPRDPQSVTSRP